MEVDFNQQNIPVMFYCLIACVCHRLPSKGVAKDAAEEGKISSENFNCSFSALKEMKKRHESEFRITFSAF